MVIRRSIFERHPWAALNIYNAFAKARGDVTRARDTSLLRHFEPGLIGDDGRKALATDPMAYGVKGNRNVLETITRSHPAARGAQGNVRAQHDGFIGNGTQSDRFPGPSRGLR